jgi:hypothetical protein
MNTNILSLPPIYMMFIDNCYYMITFEQNNQYKLYYYEKVFDYETQQNIFILKNIEMEKIKKKSMLYKIFNNQSDCITEFMSDTLLLIDIYHSKNSNPFSYFVLYKDSQKSCEFNYPTVKLNTDVNLRNKEYFHYLLTRLIEGNILKNIGRGDANQHGYAILFENLILRIMGYSIQRDGTDHINRNRIVNYRTKQVGFK